MTRKELAALVVEEGRDELARLKVSGFVERRLQTIRSHDPKAPLSRSLIYSGKEAECVDAGEPAPGATARTMEVAVDALETWLLRLQFELTYGGGR